MSAMNEKIVRLTCCAALVALASASMAREDTPESGADAIDSKQFEQDLEQAREEMARARSELAQAARRMAQIRRELAERRNESKDGERNFEFEIHEGRFEGLRELGARELILEGIPPRLGVLLGEPGSEEAATVVGLTPGSGAEAAGIERGDRLVSVNGKPIGEDPATVIREIMSGIDAGTTVPVEVRRDDELLAFDVEASSVLRDVRLIFANREPGKVEFEREVISFKPHDDGTVETLVFPPVAPLPPLSPRFSGLGHDSHLIANHAGLEPYFGTAEGVVVLRIDPDNEFALRDGDVVLRVDDEPVGRPVELGRLLLGREPGDQVVFEVMREGVLTQVPATIPDRSVTFRRMPLSEIRKFEFRSAPQPPEPPTPRQPL